MREHEAGRSRTPWRRHPWFKQISNVAAHVSAAALLAAGMANGLAARKHKSRNDDRDRRDQADRDRDGSDRNRGDKSGNDAKEDRGAQREHKQRSDRDGDNTDRNLKQERHDDNASDVHAAQRTTPTPTATPTPTPEPGGGGGGGGGNGGGTNAGSGVFDNPLATKARRRSNDFDNANRDNEDDRTFVDVDPDGESVYETQSVSLITSPDGLEIVTNNITYFAEATPTPEPLPVLELPARDPGYPFGEDFPFGNSMVVVAPTATEPPDPGDTGTTSDARAKPISSQPEPGSSDGGNNSMDFVS
jgi:hypothetical protein